MAVPNPYAPLLDAIPVERREVEVDGSTTAYWVYGPADAETTLVAVHGFRGEHHGLEPVVAHLPDVRVISPDLPGFGETPPLRASRHDIEAYAAWLRGFAAAVAPGAVILGHSFGSIVVAAAVAGGLETPKVILVNPIGAPALEGPRGVLTRLAIFYYWAGATAAAERGRRAAAQRRRGARDERVDGEDEGCGICARFIHDQHDTYFSRFADRDVLHDAFLTSVSNDVRAYAPRIAQPTLLVAAQRDDITPIEAERHLATLFPDATLVEIPDVGHLIHYETPAPAAEAIRRFLAPSAADTR